MDDLHLFSTVPEAFANCIMQYLIDSNVKLIYWHNSLINSQALIVQDGPLASLFGVSSSRTYRHTVGLLWTSDQPVAETSTYTG
jgi:hypothetical protein